MSLPGNSSSAPAAHLATPDLPAGPYSQRTVLAIESSCDETCAAVVRGRRVLSDVVASQTDLHAAFGGIVPEVASRRHLELVDAVIDRALADAGLSRVADVDAVAVTTGPGLIGALLVGVAAGTSRAWAADRPVVAVDHLMGHVASALLAPEGLEPPFLCLLVSGGHTLVLDVDEGFAVRLLGSTRDDAAGEAFDKGARLLGLGLPGGAALEQLAAGGDRDAAPFSPAMVHHDTLDTSFAGIKTALSIALRERAPDADLAAGYQDAIVRTLDACVRKLLRERGPGSGHRDERAQLAIVGGVAANASLRAALARRCRDCDTELVLVPTRWCGDNAAMIGVAASWYPELPRQIARQLDAGATSRLFRDGKLLPNIIT